MGIGVALIALAALLVAGYQLDSVWLGDLLKNGLLVVTFLAACGCGVAAYSLKGGHGNVTRRARKERQPPVIHSS